MDSYQCSKIYSDSDLLKITPKFLYDFSELQPVVGDPNILVDDTGEVQCLYIYPWTTVKIPIIDPNDKTKKDIESKILSIENGEVTVDMSLPYHSNIQIISYDSFAELITNFKGGADVSVSKESFAVYDNRIYKEGDIIDLVPYNTAGTGYTGRILDFNENKGNMRATDLTIMRLDCSIYGHINIQRFRDFDISGLYKIKLHNE